MLVLSACYITYKKSPLKYKTKETKPDVACVTQRIAMCFKFERSIELGMLVASNEIHLLSRVLTVVSFILRLNITYQLRTTMFL